MENKKSIKKKWFSTAPSMTDHTILIVLSLPLTPVNSFRANLATIGKALAIHIMNTLFFNQNCFSLVFCQWMCAGLSASSPNPSYSHIEGEIWRRVWGGSPALQVDGLLFQRSSFVCGKGSHDWICQTTYSGTGSKLQPQRTHIKVLTLLELLETIDVSS